MEPAGAQVKKHPAGESQEPSLPVPGESLPPSATLKTVGTRIGEALGGLLDAEIRVESDSPNQRSGIPLEPPVCSWRLRYRKAPAILTISGPMVHAAVDRLLGGEGAAAQGRAELTGIEKRVAGRLAESICQAISDAAEVKLALGPPAGQADVETPSDWNADSVSFGVSMFGLEGAVLLASPGGPGPLADKTKPVDGRSVPAADGTGPVELSVLADAGDLPSEHLAEIKAGDVLVTDSDCEGELEVRIDGQTTHFAKLGSKNGKRAITIVRPLDEN